MINLMEETLEDIQESGHTISDIDYCHIYEESHWKDGERDYLLGIFNSKSLDFEYDNGYGGKEVDGFVVFKDNTWLERYEYDGSECWVFKSKPKLKGN